MFVFNDGSSANWQIPLPQDGLSITSVQIDENNHLICTMSDGSTIDAGELPAGTGGSGNMTTSSLEFDGITTTFNLPTTQQVNVYVNGMYLTEDEDYTIDKTVSPYTITFVETWEETDLCTLTWIAGTGSGGGSGEEINATLATKQDILNLFKEGDNT